MEHLSDSSLSNIRNIIRATGARVTPSRVQILYVLTSAQGPLSHNDIEELLSVDANLKMDRVTLYRVLEWLVEAGLAHKATNLNGVFCFTAAEPHIEHSQHMHFRCTDCGGVFCLDLPAPLPPALPKGFRLTNMQMDISGECPSCAPTHRHTNRSHLGLKTP